MNVKSLAGDACEHFSTILTHAKYSHGFVMLFETDVEKWDCDTGLSVSNLPNTWLATPWLAWY